MVEIEFDIKMKCVAECDDLIVAYIEEAKESIKKGLRKDLRNWYGVTVKEIEVEAKI